MSLQPGRKPPTSTGTTAVPVRFIRKTAHDADLLALAYTEHVIDGLDQLQAQYVLRTLALSHLDEVRHALSEEGLLS